MELLQVIFILIIVLGAIITGVYFAYDAYITHEDQLKNLSNNYSYLENNLNNVNTEVANNKNYIDYAQGMLDQIHSSYVSDSTLSTTVSEINQNITSLSNKFSLTTDGKVKYCETPTNCKIIANNDELQQLLTSQNVNASKISQLNSSISTISSGEYIPTGLYLNAPIISDTTNDTYLIL